MGFGPRTPDQPIRNVEEWGGRAALIECEYAYAFGAKGDEHRIFPTDVIGNPAEERSGQTIEDAVNSCRESHGTRCHSHKGDWHSVDFPIDRDRLEICRNHQTTRPHEYEHEVHQPE